MTSTLPLLLKEIKIAGGTLFLFFRGGGQNERKRIEAKKFSIQYKSGKQRKTTSGGTEYGTLNLFLDACQKGVHRNGFLFVPLSLCLWGWRWAKVLKVHGSRNILGCA